MNFISREGYLPIRENATSSDPDKELSPEVEFILDWLDRNVYILIVHLQRSGGIVIHEVIRRLPLPYGRT